MASLLQSAPRCSPEPRIVVVSRPKMHLRGTLYVDTHSVQKKKKPWRKKVKLDSLKIYRYVDDLHVKRSSSPFTANSRSNQKERMNFYEKSQLHK